MRADVTVTYVDVPDAEERAAAITALLREKGVPGEAVADGTTLAVTLRAAEVTTTPSERDAR